MQIWLELIQQYWILLYFVSEIYKLLQNSHSTHQKLIRFQLELVGGLQAGAPKASLIRVKMPISPTKAIRKEMFAVFGEKHCSTFQPSL